MPKSMYGMGNNSKMGGSGKKMMKKSSSKGMKKGMGSMGPVSYGGGYPKGTTL